MTVNAYRQIFLVLSDPAIMAISTSIMSMLLLSVSVCVNTGPHTTNGYKISLRLIHTEELVACLI